MTKEAFKKKFGVYPSEALDNKTPIKPQNDTKKPSNTKKGIMYHPRVKKALELNHEDLSEDQHQEFIVQWLEAKNIYFEVSINGIFLPNPHPKGSVSFLKQRKANASVIKKLKKVGYRKGVADIKVFLPNIELNIELKKIGGDPTKEQVGNVEVFKEFNYATYVIIEGYKEVIKYIESFLD